MDRTNLTNLNFIQISYLCIGKSENFYSSQFFRRKLFLVKMNIETFDDISDKRFTNYKLCM